MIEKQFTALLRSFVQDTAPKTEEPWNMAELQRAAAQQNMLPVLAYENKRWRLSTDSEVCRRLDGFLYGAIVGNLNRRVGVLHICPLKAIISESFIPFRSCARLGILTCLFIGKTGKRYTS